jgi:hypothetical protein
VGLSLTVTKPWLSRNSRLRTVARWWMTRSVVWSPHGRRACGYTRGVAPAMQSPISGNLSKGRDLADREHWAQAAVAPEPSDTVPDGLLGGLFRPTFGVFSHVK